MELNDYIKYTIEAFKRNGLASIINEDKANKLYLLYHLLIETNKTTNLTAITDEIEVIYKHFIDSATISRDIPPNSTVIDVGCGAGFPTLPLAILRSDIKITAIDSTGKKINFVSEAASKLNLTNVEAICTRAEDFSKLRRESFDICTSRAVARLNVLSELCIPFVKAGGRFIAMKSSKMSEEYAEAKCGISKLGCQLKSENSVEIKWDNGSLTREIYVFIKTQNTPAAYPRNYSQIVKKPL